MWIRFITLRIIENKRWLIYCYFCIELLPKSFGTEKTSQFHCCPKPQRSRKTFTRKLATISHQVPIKLFMINITPLWSNPDLFFVGREWVWKKLSSNNCTKARVHFILYESSHKTRNYSIIEMNIFLSWDGRAHENE